MIAEIIAVGTELLLGQIVNSNSQFLGRALAELGINVYHSVVVGDNESRLVAALEEALSRSDVVITTGGLGPTADDLTREGVSVALGRPLGFDERVWRDIEGFFKRVGRSPTPNNRRQAYVIDGARVLDNPNGTAPGLIIPHGDKTVIMLPGPPGEMIPMFERFVADYLKGRGAGNGIIHSRILKVCGLGESSVEDNLGDLMGLGPNPTLAPYAYPGEVHLRLTARGESIGEARALIEPVERRIREIIGEYVFGSDEDTIELAAGRRLRALGLTVGLGESCTGGLIGHRLTQVPGSSDYFRGGVVAYSNEVKMAALGVKRETLEHFGAVSGETAAEMSEGARVFAGSDVGIGVTGIAGPSGGTAAKPVGTVHLAIAGPRGAAHKRLALWGSRESIKWRASQEALAMLWKYLAPGKDAG